jgi:XTP/dITP diphosphohydrolase
VPRRPEKIVLASGNPGKLREIARILADFAIEVVPQSEFGVADADETGSTFVENALIKARHAAAATGLPAIADDSGICVDALDGRPGVYSARYGGLDASDATNNARLLEELEGVPDEGRGAAFHCVACFVMPDGSEPVISAGEWRGRILHAPRGTGGFGYDPLFLVPELGKSSAELTPEEKNARSHRGKALAGLARKLHDLEWN